jgi:hypothetical protein
MAATTDVTWITGVAAALEFPDVTSVIAYAWSMQLRPPKDALVR